MTDRSDVPGLIERLRVTVFGPERLRGRVPPEGLVAVSDDEFDRVVAERRQPRVFPADTFRPGGPRVGREWEAMCEKTAPTTGR